MGARKTNTESMELALEADLVKVKKPVHRLLSDEEEEWELAKTIKEGKEVAAKFFFDKNAELMYAGEHLVLKIGFDGQGLDTDLSEKK